jgi:hypothetical protein
MITTHTEKVSNNTRGCRLCDVKKNGYKNSYPTEVKRTSIHQNLSISCQKVFEISVKPKALHKTSAPISQFWIFFILNFCSFHFQYVAIILYLWLMKFFMPEKYTLKVYRLIGQDKRSCFFPTFSVCEHSENETELNLTCKSSRTEM